MDSVRLRGGSSALGRLMRIARYTRWIAAVTVLYWLALFIGTHIPLRLPPGSVPEGGDKLLHFVAYLGLAYLLGLWLSVKQPMSARHYLMILLVIAVYGALDELLQGPVNRNPDVYDWIADVFGGIAGLMLLYATRQLCRRCFETEESQ
jgi:VanZ family protein